MAINNDPLFAFERNLTQEQLAQMLALRNNPQQRWETESGTILGDRGGSLPGQFGPGIGFTPNQVNRGTGVGADAEFMDDPTGAGDWQISQARNISNFGNNDVTGTWDENGNWTGWNSGMTGGRMLGNLGMMVAGGAYTNGGFGDPGSATTTAGTLGTTGGNTLSAAEQSLLNGGGYANDLATLTGSSPLTSGAGMNTFGTTIADAGLLSTAAGGVDLAAIANGTGTPPAGGTPPTGSPPTNTPPPGGNPPTTTPPPATSAPFDPTKLLTDPNVIKTGVTLGGALLADKGGNGNGADLSQVKPADLFQTMNATGQQNWQNQVAASRYNVTNPNGSSTWSQTPNFNQQGFDAAMAQWQAAGNPNIPQPTKDQFTSQQWTNSSTLSPQAQALYDTQRNNQQSAASNLSNQFSTYATNANKGVDTSGIPGYQYGADSQQQKQVNLGAAPKYGQIQGPGAMGNPEFGDITRGALVSNVGETARDWAGQVQPKLDSYSDRLAGMDPWAYDDKGSDAMYGMQTRYMLPQQEQERKALENRLGEQGFVPGTPAYEQALRQVSDSQAQAQAQARDAATLAGRQFGDQAFDNQAGALNSAIAAQLGLGNLGIATDKNAFDQKLANANLSNTAQGQDFNQQNVLSEQQFKEGIAANDVVKSLFGMNMDAANSNNKWSAQSFDDLIRGTTTNNAAISGNNQNAIDRATLNNNAVTNANTNARENFTTNTNAQRNVFTDLNNIANKDPTMNAPGPGITSVPGQQTPNLSELLQTYFGNNVDLANQDTASYNANMLALSNFLASMFGGK